MAGKAAKRPTAGTAASGRIGIVAGGGRVPVLLAEQLAAAGQPPFVAMIEGSADPALAKHEHMPISTAAPGKLLAGLKKAGVATVTIVGSVAGRPDLSQFRPDWTTLKLATRILSGLRSGDDALLREIVKMHEDAGIRVVGAHELVPELLATFGPIAGPAPKQGDMRAIALGVRAARALGQLDVGQACVVIGNRIVALEGAEGTDEMLRRVAKLRLDGRLSNKRGGVLVKMCKPGQEKRVDMPTIGTGTVENVHLAGLTGIAVQGESTMIVDLGSVRAQCEASKMFLIGIDGDGHLPAVK